MPEPIDVVRSFFEQVNREGSVAAFERWLAPEVVWENAGAPTCNGRDACIAFDRGGAEMLGYDHWTAELRGIAADGDLVLTDRIDRLIKADGSVLIDIEVMGSLRIAGEQIVEWREYFNPIPLAGLVGGEAPSWIEAAREGES